MFPAIGSLLTIELHAPSSNGLSLTGVRDIDAATEWLLRELDSLALGPFDHPVVLAHHPAMRRALTLGIARATGCAASIRFVSPTSWVDEIAGMSGADGEWRTSAMTWRLTASMMERAESLPNSVRQIVDSDDTIALLDLARAVATRFRAYLLHRPDLLLHWETSSAVGTENEQWQRTLWRSLVGSSPSPARIVADVRAGRFRCPESVAPVILAVADPTMPPTVRDVLRAIGVERSVRWCVVAFGGTSERAIVSPRLRAAISALPLSPMPPREETAATLLGRVQQLIDGEVPTDSNRELDDALTLHACHSPLREIETLRERLVVAMEVEPDLLPHDVTLYVTSLERYLPAIDAVFGLDEPGLPRLPYNVAGRPFRDGSPVVFAFLRLLEASEGRTTLEEISALLRLTPVSAAAGFAELETATVLSLLVQAGVVWGTDGADRQHRFQLPPLEAGTWRNGIDRLVLGIALGRTDSPVGDVLPVSGDSAGNANLIGRIAGWTEQLFALFTELRTPRAAHEWTDVLERAIRTFVSPRGAEDFEAMRQIRLTVEEVLDSIASVSPRALVAMPAVRTLLEQAFEEMAGELGHLRGGVRVCRLEPGTVLPTRVVLIAGVDDALHPSVGSTPAWDLLSASPQPEDPDRRSDALDAFRQAIGSARSRVHVAWTGFTTLRHEPRAPSIAVSELHDLAQRVLSADAIKGLVREEPAHPFSASHFAIKPGAGRIQSASRGWGAAARLIRTRGEKHRGFAENPLSTTDQNSRVVSLSTLSACFKDPSLFFCQRQLGLQMYDDEEQAEREPQALNPPNDKGAPNALRRLSWRLEAAQRRNDVRTPAEIAEWMQHQPEMPYGEEGRVLAAAVAEEWWSQLEALRDIDWQHPQPVELVVGDWTIVGRLDRLTPDARVMECLYEIRPHSALSQWVPHLVMNVLADSGRPLPRKTLMKGASEWTLAAVKDAEAELIKLCAFYEETCLAPQPLFRRSGCAWLEELGMRPEAEAGEAERAKADRKAHDAWHPQAALPGQKTYPRESESGSSLLCWAGRGFDDDPEFVELFKRCTERMLLPFMRACVTAEGA